MGTNKAPHTMSILDTCRGTNSGILNLDTLTRDANDPDVSRRGELDRSTARGFVGFVPAAGAASRYTAPLAEFTSLLKPTTREAAIRVATQLRNNGALTWPLDPKIAALIEDPATITTAPPAALRAAAKSMRLPKALTSCVRGGVTFLEMKAMEHSAIGDFTGQVFVAPAFGTRGFTRILSKYATRNKASDVALASIRSKVLEQGVDLSTIRLRRDGTPAREADGQLSLVPAGHGALIRLFGHVQLDFPEAHSVFIRNIDGVIGVRAQTVKACRQFLAAHQIVLNFVRDVRTALHADRLTGLGASILDFLARAGIKTEAKAPVSVANIEELLWKVQDEVFHCSASTPRTRASLASLFDRPVNTLGQVPNLGSDVGGTPVFLDVSPAKWNLRGEAPRKVCLELSHATPEDAEKTMRNPARATHFNPVFLAAEISDDTKAGQSARGSRETLAQQTSRLARYEWSNHPWWVIAQKKWRGEDVYYHESLLFEILGNSAMANVTFVEIPRFLFNPHKTLADSAKHSLADWT